MTATIHLTGNLGQAPDEIQAGSSGVLYVRFSVASTERKKDSQGNWSDGDTSWYNCTAFGNAAELVKETLGKGDPVILDGKLNLRPYEVNGEKRISADIRVDSIGLDLSRAKRKSSESRQQQRSDFEPPPF